MQAIDKTAGVTFNLPYTAEQLDDLVNVTATLEWDGSVSINLGLKAHCSKGSLMEGGAEYDFTGLEHFAVEAAKAINEFVAERKKQRAQRGETQ